MTKFQGTVNGVTYTSVQEYNTALTTAIENNEPINAYSRTYTVDCDENADLGTTMVAKCDKCDDKCEDPNCSCGCIQQDTTYEDIVKKYGLLSVFDLDKLDGTKEDEDIIKNLKHTLNKDYAKSWVDKALNCIPQSAFEHYVDDVTKLYDKLTIQDNENDNALFSLNRTCDELCKTIKDATEKLKKYTNRKNICEHAREILRTELDFFDYIIYKLNYNSTDLCKKMNEQKKDFDNSQSPNDSDGFRKLIKEILDVDLKDLDADLKDLGIY